MGVAIRTHGRRPLACHHEAGHAVARWWLGIHVDHVVVLTVDEVRAGVTVQDSRGRAHRCEGHVGGYDIHTPMARRILMGEWDTAANRDAFALRAAERTGMALVESYAGPYAEARFMRRSAYECFTGGGMGDMNAAREIAADWFETEEDQRAARAGADAIARALIRSPKGWAAIQSVAVALLDLGRLDGDDIDELCSVVYGVPFAYGRWDGTWPPTPAQIRAGLLPLHEPRRVA